MTDKRIDDLKKFFNMRNINITLEFNIVSRFDYNQICDTLSKIIDHNEDCYFDITGGKELLLTAIGEISVSKNVPVFQFDIKSGDLIKVKNCNNIKYTENSCITINESMVLNGGAIVHNFLFDYDWDMNDDFKNDVDIIWNICKQDCRAWNKFSNLLEHYETYNESGDDLYVCIDKSNTSKLNGLNSEILDELINKNIILEYNILPDRITYKYKNEQIRKCITKAGNILELYAYSAVLEIAHNNPGYYDDVDIGVFVDWDGIDKTEYTSDVDTRNEVDIILMRDLVPVFISCKNGEINKEALYELSAIAEHFGGEYSKKVILATYISTNPKSRNYILQRAKDMKIDIIEDVNLMSRDEFLYVLKDRV